MPSDHEDDVHTAEDSMQLDSHGDQPSSSTTTAPAKKRKPRDPQANAPIHTPGKSVFPVSRVQKILKADKVRLHPSHYVLANKHDAVATGAPTSLT